MAKGALRVWLAAETGANEHCSGQHRRGLKIGLSVAHQAESLLPHHAPE
jgi:hypothetical protein